MKNRFKFVLPASMSEANNILGWNFKTTNKSKHLRDFIFGDSSHFTIISVKKIDIRMK